MFLMKNVHRETMNKWSAVGKNESESDFWLSSLGAKRHITHGTDDEEERDDRQNWKVYTMILKKIRY